MDYVTLPLAGVRAEFDRTARDADAVFGRLDARQLNWRPDATRWSVARCFDLPVVTAASAALPLRRRRGDAMR
jgi:hypothetical protein